MQRNQSATCESCPFWDLFGNKDDGSGRSTGICRRYAPALQSFRGQFSGLDSEEGAWPETNDNDWCGEHPYFSTPKKINPKKMLSCRAFRILRKLRPTSDGYSSWSEVLHWVADNGKWQDVLDVKGCGVAVEIELRQAFDDIGKWPDGL